MRLGQLRPKDRLIEYACFEATPSTDGTYDLNRLARRSGGAGYAGTGAFYLATGYREAARVKDFHAPADDRIMLAARLTMDERGVATR
jgi:lysine/ornithine N-monooxygenase